MAGCKNRRGVAGEGEGLTKEIEPKKKDEDGRRRRRRRRGALWPNETKALLRLTRWGGWPANESSLCLSRCVNKAAGKAPEPNNTLSLHTRHLYPKCLASPSPLPQPPFSCPSSSSFPPSILDHVYLLLALTPIRAPTTIPTIGVLVPAPFPPSSTPPFLLPDYNKRLLSRCAPRQCVQLSYQSTARDT